jgi:hypothetical protein
MLLILEEASAIKIKIDPTYQYLAQPPLSMGFLVGLRGHKTFYVPT